MRHKTLRMSCKMAERESRGVIHPNKKSTRKGASIPGGSSALRPKVDLSQQILCFHVIQLTMGNHLVILESSNDDPLVYADQL